MFFKKPRTDLSKYGVPLSTDGSGGILQPMNRRPLGSHTQKDLVRAFTGDFAVMCKLTTSESTRRSGVLKHLYNFCVH